MRKLLFSTLTLSFILLLSGCLTTLHPIFTEKDLAYNPMLLGSWKTENNGKTGKVNITNLATENSVELPGNISSIKNKGYFIKYFDENGNASGKYIAFLAKIGKYHYFDYFPATEKDDPKIDEFFEAHFIKMHTSYRVDISSDDSFQLSRLDESFLKKLMDEKKIRISHEIDADDNTVITASTKDLQQYLIKYGDEPSAYLSDKTIFTK